MNKNYKDRGSLHTRVRKGGGANPRPIWLNSCAPARPAYANVSPKSPKLAWHVWIQRGVKLLHKNKKHLLHPHMSIKRHLLFCFYTLEKTSTKHTCFSFLLLRRLFSLIEFAVVVCRNFQHVLSRKFVLVVSWETVTSRPKALQ